MFNEENHYEIHLYNELAKKLNEIIDELNKPVVNKNLEFQELLKKCQELKIEIDRKNLAYNQVLDEKITNVTNDIIEFEEKHERHNLLVDLIDVEMEYFRKKKILNSGYAQLNDSRDGLIKLLSMEGNTLVNLVVSMTNNGIVNKSQTVFISLRMNLLANKDYTFILDVTRESGTGKLRIRQSKADESEANYQSVFLFNADIKYQFVKFTPEYEYKAITFYTDDKDDSYVINNFMIIEGDYTNKPIPNYFTGMQSSFEDKVVTQEMVDSGKELSENLGKYKVDYKVTGKNKFKLSSLAYQKTLLTPIKKGEIYTLSYDYSEGNTGNNRVQLMTTFTGNQSNNGEVDGRVDYVYKHSLIGRNSITITSTIDGYLYLRIVTPKPTNNYISNIQLEEGDAATAYEPYKENIKTYYLNSPLLEGDTIEDNGNDVVHVHRSELVAYTEGDESTYTTDLTNTIKTKPSPTYEVIDTNNLIRCYEKCSIEFDSAIPLNKLEIEYSSIIEEV